MDARTCTYDVTPRVTQRDEGPADVLGQWPSEDEMLYQISKSGPCITSWSHKHMFICSEIYGRVTCLLGAETDEL